MKPLPEDRDQLEQNKDDAIESLIQKAREEERIDDLENFIADIGFWIEEDNFKEDYKDAARYYVVDELLGRQLIDFMTEPENFRESGYKFSVDFSKIEDVLKEDLRSKL